MEQERTGEVKLTYNNSHVCLIIFYWFVCLIVSLFIRIYMIIISGGQYPNFSFQYDTDY